MKCLLASFLYAPLFLAGILVSTSSCEARDSQSEMGGHVYQTRLGAVHFLYDDTHAGAPSKIVKLGSQVLLRAATPKDENAYHPSYMEEFGSEQLSSVKSNDGVPLISRMIVAEGEDGNCIRQYIILDFTGAEPYVSKPLGYNPDGTACLELKKVRWGHDVSYIYLEGPMKYAYHAYGDIVGPLE